MIPTLSVCLCFNHCCCAGVTERGARSFNVVCNSKDHFSAHAGFEVNDHRQMINSETLFLILIKQLIPTGKIDEINDCPGVELGFEPMFIRANRLFA